MESTGSIKLMEEEEWNRSHRKGMALYLVDFILWAKLRFSLSTNVDLRDATYHMYCCYDLQTAMHRAVLVC